MRWNHVQTDPIQPPQPTQTPCRPPPFRRLGAALLIFALCYVGARWVPAVKAQAEPFLRNILSCSCDFEEAVRCFSTQMEQGGGVQDALEDFCVTAFAVQPTSTSTSLQGDYSPFLNALSWNRTR